MEEARGETGRGMTRRSFLQAAAAGTALVGAAGTMGWTPAFRIPVAGAATIPGPPGFPSSIDLYQQDTPRHALVGFLRALEKKRYDVILRYVPDSHREGLDAAKLKAAWEGADKDEIESVVAGLKQALPSASIEETGDHAQMPYGAGVMKLVKEHGQWKVEDFD